MCESDHYLTVSGDDPVAEFCGLDDERLCSIKRSRTYWPSQQVSGYIEGLCRMLMGVGSSVTLVNSKFIAMYVVHLTAPVV
jgi:hypothetical protein